MLPNIFSKDHRIFILKSNLSHEGNAPAEDAEADIDICCFVRLHFITVSDVSRIIGGQKGKIAIFF